MIHIFGSRMLHIPPLFMNHIFDTRLISRVEYMSDSWLMIHTFDSTHHSLFTCLTQSIMHQFTYLTRSISHHSYIWLDSCVPVAWLIRSSFWARVYVVQKAKSMSEMYCGVRERYNDVCYVLWCAWDVLWCVLLITQKQHVLVLAAVYPSSASCFPLSSLYTLSCSPSPSSCDCSIQMGRICGQNTSSKPQHTATHCNTLRHTATHCNTLQHTATHCNTLQHTATHRNAPHRNKLQHTATHRNAPQHTATHSSIPSIPRGGQTSCGEAPLNMQLACRCTIISISTCNSSSSTRTSTCTIWCCNSSFSSNNPSSRLVQPIADRVAQNLEIISKKIQFSTRRTRILMGFIISTICYVVLIVNPMGRILVGWKRFVSTRICESVLNLCTVADTSTSLQHSLQHTLQHILQHTATHTATHWNAYCNTHCW